MKICPYCSAKNVDSAKFCSNCRAKLTGSKKRLAIILALPLFAIVGVLLCFLIVLFISNISLSTPLLSPQPKSPNIVSSYPTQTIDVPAGTNTQEYIQDYYPELLQLEEEYNIGGMKLIVDMSVDKSPYYPHLSEFKRDVSIDIKTLEDLQLAPITDLENIVHYVFNGDVSIIKCCVRGELIVNVMVANNTDHSITSKICQGQMIEVEAPNVQNVVVIKDTQIELAPKAIRTLGIKTFCASRSRGNPSGKSAKITPYKLKAPSSAYQSQEDVWNYQEPYRTVKDEVYTITFYAWGAGDETPSGISTFGHAFVYIETLGTFGYGGRSGELFGDESAKVYNHTKHVAYATHKYSVKVNGKQLEAIRKEFGEWWNNPPSYFLGRNDCTTFVLDIADAGRIRYGYRWNIQTPVGLLEGLEEYNNVVEDEYPTEYLVY